MGMKIRRRSSSHPAETRVCRGSGITSNNSTTNDTRSSSSSTSTDFEKLLSSWWVGIGCCVFRMVNAWFVDSQFDPDEYWQTLEVAYCHVFGWTTETNNCVATWEWTGDSPIRSYVSILPVWLLYKVLQLSGHDTSRLVAKGPSLLYALCFAGPTDWIVARLASSLPRSTPTVTISTTTTTAGLWALFFSLTSWFHGYCLVRTYTNSIECFLITLITALLLMPNSKGSLNNCRNYRTALAFFLMGITVAGVRFTSLAAFLPLYLYTLFSLWQRPTTNKLTLYLFLLLSCFYGFLGIFLCIIIDRYFYGFWTIVSLNNFYINILRNYSSLYGTHPFYWYFFVGIPVVSGTTILVPILLALFSNLYSPPTIITKLHTATSLHHKLFGALILSYLLLHSLSAHKEFRFILPISPFICILTGNLLDLAHHHHHQRGGQRTKDRGMKRRRRLILVVLTFLTMTINFGVWYYLSRIHQRAPIHVNRLLLAQIDRTPGINANIVTSTVHYLMGCHSTPIYSHLHAHHPIQVRTLDCSPNCRILEQQPQDHPVCESSLFLHHPLAFVESFYGIHSPSSCSSTVENPFCSIAANQTLPDFIAIYEKEAREVHEVLVQQMGMKLVHRIPNGIRNIQLKFTQSPKINYDFMYLYQKTT